MNNYSRVPLLLALLVCVETITIVAANDGVILVEPRSVNTTLNTPVQFYCEGRGTIILWKIDGIQFIHNLNKHRGIEQGPQQTNTTTNTILSILDVPAQPVNDGATFTCSVVGSKSSESDGAILRIQGLLAEVGNLTPVYIGNFSVQVVWEPPQSLDGVPILGYNATVTPVDSISDDMYSISTLSTSFLLNGSALEACQDYKITVVAINKVGPGNASLVTLNNYPGDPQVRNTQVSVKASTGQDHRFLNLSAQSTGECTEQYPTQGFAYLRSIIGNLSVIVNLTINNALLSGITREVPSDKHYSLDMMLHNKAGSILSTQVTEFSTFDTQGLVLGRTSTGLACFGCTFLEGSRAEGCLIHLMSRDSVHSVTSYRPTSNHHHSDWNCTRQFSDGLTARIFDVEFDGSVSSNPALVVESVTINDSVTLVSYAADSTGTPIATSTIRAPIADGGSTPIIAALVSVFTVVILTLAVLVLIVFIAVRRRRKIPDTQVITEAHHGVNTKLQKSNSKHEDVIFTNPNPVYDVSLSVTKDCGEIHTAANPLYGSSGIKSACDNPVYDTVKGDCAKVNDKMLLMCSTTSDRVVYDTVNGDYSEKAHLMSSMMSDRTLPAVPAQSAANSVYDTVGNDVCLKEPLQEPSQEASTLTPYAVVPNYYVAKHNKAT